MTVQEFFDKYNGQGIDFDGFYGNQCMDEAEQYNHDVVGAPKLTGNAADVWDNYPTSFYDKIANTPDGVPQKGDIVIWNRRVGGGFGHIAIFNEGNANRFTSFDQNWPTGSNCHFQEHDYSNVFGWIRPHLPADQNQQATIDELRKARDDNWNLYQTEIEKNNTLSEQVQNLTNDLHSTEDKLGKCLSLTNELNDEDKNTTAQLLDAQKALQPLQDEILAVRKALGITDTADISLAINVLKTSKVKREPRPVGFLAKLQFLFT